MQRLHRFRFGGQSDHLGFSFRSASTALDDRWRCVRAIDAAPTGTIAPLGRRSDLIIIVDHFDGAAGRHQAKVLSFSAIRSVAGHGVYDFVRARKIQTEALPATLATLTILKSERWASRLAVCFFILRIHLSQECKHLVRHLAGHGIKLSKSFANSRLNSATP
jgi:hypothetical protein